jgi:NAD(P)-dependent dehydrogenase (short-subunit alcohol dehydrogenase family)
MQIERGHVVITGAASGLGEGLAREARRRGAARIGLVDVDAKNLCRIAGELEATAVTANLTDRAETERAIDRLLDGGIPDLAIANAGAIAPSDHTADDGSWELGWRLHVMSNVWLFRRLVPLMVSRGGGHLACTASSASFAPNPKSIVYSVTKQAQLGLAEWVACLCRSSGLGFTCFCPGGMRTPMLERMAGPDAYSQRAMQEADTPERAAGAFLDGIEAGRFLVTTQRRTVGAMRSLAADPEAFLEASAATFRDLRTPIDEVPC